MIKLFNVPNHKIDTAQFSNLLHDRIVSEFEQNLADYVGAKHCVTFNSATSAMFLLLSFMKQNVKELNIAIPSIIPPVVPNTIINAGLPVRFLDEVSWVGGNYTMTETQIMGYIDIIDSAHEIYGDHYNDVKSNDSDLVIYSFYPTKPLSGMDGGAIVSNESSLIDMLRILSKNGLQSGGVQKYIGHKMYMNSVQAYIANENLKAISERQERINEIRGRYNTELKCQKYVTDSDHLYIIRVENNHVFAVNANINGIECKIHYPALHGHPLFDNRVFHPFINDGKFKHSVEFGDTCVSIPFHEALTDEEVETVIKYVNSHAE